MKIETIASYQDVKYYIDEQQLLSLKKRVNTQRKIIEA